MTVASPRALSATIIAIVPPETQDAAARTLVELAGVAGVRPIVVSLGDRHEAPRSDRDGAIVISGLIPRYLNNAVASLRLSSLPSIGWWRSHHAAPMRDLAVLVDRLLLDAEDPLQGWAQVPELATLTGVGDLRWTRLTRWRDLLAQFLDVPVVGRLEHPFERVEVIGADRYAAALLAGWLKAKLPGGEQLNVSIQRHEGPPLERVELEGAAGNATLRLLSNGTCLRATVQVSATAGGSARVAALGEQDTVSLLAAELRIRSRDLAFEDAVKEAIAL